MKFLISLIMIIIVLPATFVLAEDEILLGDKVEHGGYIGPEMKIALINGDWEIMMGVRGGWIINRQLVLGLAGYGLVTNLINEDDIYYDYYYDYRPYELGYGGFLVEYISNPQKLSHISLSLLVGGGSIVRNEDIWFGPEYDPLYYPWGYYPTSDEFFVFEPGVNFMVNVSKHVRAGLGMSYRFIEGLDSRNEIYSNYYTNSDISGPSFNINMKFGKF